MRISRTRVFIVLVLASLVVNGRRVHSLRREMGVSR
jgi:hypothetical protein